MKKNQTFNKSLKLLFKTSMFVLGGVLLSKIFTYAYRIIIARHFGAEVYGRFSLALVILSWFTAISALGLPEGVLRFISIYRGRKQKNKIEKIRYLVRISSIILFFSTIIIAVLSFLLSDFIALRIFHDPNLIIFLKVFSFMIPFSVFAVYFLSIMGSFEKIKQQSFIMDVLKGVVILASLVVLIAFGFNTNSIIISFFLGTLIIFLLSYLYCKYWFSEIFKKKNLKKQTLLTQNLISYSWPIMFFGIISTIFYSIDSFLLGYLKTTTEVGLYNAAVPIALLLSLTPLLFLRLLLPMIIKEYSQKNFKLIKELSKQVGKWVFMINFPIFLLIIVFPGAIINILGFGQEYLVAENSLRILVFGTLISSLFVISQNLISMVGKSKTILIDLIITSVLNIVLNFLFIPRQSIIGIDNTLGINGAAIATVISIVFFNFLLMIQANKYTGVIPVRRKMFRIFLIALVPFFTLLYFRSIVSINYFSIIILIGIFFLLYTLLLFLFRALDRNDLMILKAVKHRLSGLVK